MKGDGDGMRLDEDKARGAMPGLGARAMEQLKCSYTNAGNTDKKQDLTPNTSEGAKSKPYVLE